MSLDQQGDRPEDRLGLASSGMTLMELLVTAMIGSLLSIGMSEYLKNRYRAFHSMKAQMELDASSNRLTMQLLTSESCLRLFRGSPVGSGVTLGHLDQSSNPPLTYISSPLGLPSGTPSFEPIARAGGKFDSSTNWNVISFSLDLRLNSYLWAGSAPVVNPVVLTPPSSVPSDVPRVISYPGVFLTIPSPQTAAAIPAGTHPLVVQGTGTLTLNLENQMVKLPAAVASGSPAARRLLRGYGAPLTTKIIQFMMTLRQMAPGGTFELIGCP